MIQKYAVAMRLFVGIGLPLSLAEELARAARGLAAPGEHARIRWTPPENLHLTISFLGQVEPARLEGIEQALAKIRSPRLYLALDGVGVFPNAGILYARVKPMPALLDFTEEVFRAVESCGFPREQRLFAPHITLARSKGRLRLNDSEQRSAAFQRRFEAHEFGLYESLTLSRGAQYRVLRAIAFS